MSRQWLGRRIVEMDVCGSTSDEIAVLAAEGAPHGTVVWAHAQTRGRGRLGRTWHSPPDAGLYLSCLLRPNLAPAQLPPVTLAAGIAVCETAQAFGVPARLKWPNDVVVPGPELSPAARAVGGRKLAGVLTEMQSRGVAVSSAVVGIGLNLAASELPPELDGLVTSMSAFGPTPASGEVLEVLLDQLELFVDRFLSLGVAGIASSWMAASCLRDVIVDAVVGGEPVRGTVRGLTASGGLEIEDDGGRAWEVVSGEVRLAEIEDAKSPGPSSP